MPTQKYDRYFGGHATKARGAMEKEYGAEKGEDVFYALKNKRAAAEKNSLMRPKRKGK
jgi:hypothetical protein